MLRKRSKGAGPENEHLQEGYERSLLQRLESETTKRLVTGVVQPGCPLRSEIMSIIRENDGVRLFISEQFIAKRHQKAASPSGENRSSGESEFSGNWQRGGRERKPTVRRLHSECYPWAVWGLGG
jgi:hypothetical protein